MDQPDPDTPDVNRPADPQQDPSARVAQAIAINRLGAALCEAIGIDPDRNEGFQLVTRGGQIPELTIYAIPPQNEADEFTDEWVTGLRDLAARGLTFAVLPGQNTTAPPARDPGPMDLSAVPDEIHLEVILGRILPMLAEVINGAYVNSDTRDWLTAMAHRCATQLEARVNQVIFSMFPGGPATQGITTTPPPDTTTTHTLGGIIDGGGE